MDIKENEQLIILKNGDIIILPKNVLLLKKHLSKGRYAGVVFHNDNPHLNYGFLCDAPVYCLDDLKESNIIDSCKFKSSNPVTDNQVHMMGGIECIPEEIDQSYVKYPKIVRECKWKKKPITRKPIIIKNHLIAHIVLKLNYRK
ncbi:MAG: hypothetical protein IJ141_09700 [Lachnospiraceae bacterium]|nr:hypothetical protein [Lachnospiraceae bacterium]